MNVSSRLSCGQTASTLMHDNMPALLSLKDSGGSFLHSEKAVPSGRTTHGFPGRYGLSWLVVDGRCIVLPFTSLTCNPQGLLGRLMENRFWTSSQRMLLAPAARRKAEAQKLTPLQYTYALDFGVERGRGSHPPGRSANLPFWLLAGQVWTLQWLNGERVKSSSFCAQPHARPPARVKA